MVECSEFNSIQNESSVQILWTQEKERKKKFSFDFYGSLTWMTLSEVLDFPVVTLWDLSYS